MLVRKEAPVPTSHEIPRRGRRRDHSEASQPTNADASEGRSAAEIDSGSTKTVGVRG
jgi:hypothetical protein